MGPRKAYVSACLAIALALAGCAPPGPAWVAPDRAVAVSEAAAGELVTRWTQALSQGGSATVLVATEEEITSVAAANLAGTPIERLIVWIEPRGLIALAHIRLGGLHTVSGLLHLKSDDRALSCAIPAAYIDGRPIVRWLRLSIQQAICDALADANLPFFVEEVSFGEGTVKVVVTSR